MTTDAANWLRQRSHQKERHPWMSSTSTDQLQPEDISQATMVARYDHQATTKLDQQQLAQVLYLILQSCIDPDDYDDRHDLRQDREEAFDLAQTLADNFINHAPVAGFAKLLTQHLEESSATLPWPNRQVNVSTQDGRINATVKP